MIGTGVRVALMAPNWLGDAVMSLGAVAELHAAGARTIVVARPSVARVYAGLVGIDELVVMRARRRAARILEGARVLGALEPDAVAILPPSLTAAIVASLGGVPRRAGYATDLRAPLLTDAIDARGLREEHVSENARRVARRALRAAGLVPAREMPEPPPPRIGEADRARAAALLEGAGIAGAYVVVAPGAAYGPAKSWPEARFAELVGRLGRREDVVLLGSARDRARCERIASAAGAGTVLAGATDVGAALALVARARAVVANDSGAAHLAAWAGTPVVAVFGSTSPVWTAPRGARVRIVRHPVACSPCFRRRCPTHLECFEGVTVDRVVAAVHEVAGGPARADGRELGLAHGRPTG